MYWSGGDFIWILHTGVKKRYVYKCVGLAKLTKHGVIIYIIEYKSFFIFIRVICHSAHKKYGGQYDTLYDRKIKYNFFSLFF
jgi:hypothetical protein